MSVKRTLTICRDEHAYKEINATGLMNRVKDSVPLSMYIDKNKIGLLKKEPIIIEIDNDEHILQWGGSLAGIDGTKYRIPADDRSYVARYFRSTMSGSFSIGVDGYDPFLESVINYIMGLFKGQEMTKRLSDSNNVDHGVELYISSDGIRLFFPLHKTKGINQWSLGGQEEIISYTDAGITVPKSELIPTGYFKYISDSVLSSIMHNDSLNLEYNENGRISFSKKRRLF